MLNFEQKMFFFPDQTFLSYLFEENIRQFYLFILLLRILESKELKALISIRI